MKTKMKINMKNKKLDCLVKNCNHKIYSRGLCQSCYRYARFLIRENEMTEKELIKEGKLLPKRITLEMLKRKLFFSLKK